MEDWVQRGLDIDGWLNDGSGRVSLSADGGIVAIGALNDGNGITSGLYVYSWDGSMGPRGGYYGEAEFDNNGTSVSLSLTEAS